jgi:hypothetical protein
LARIEVLLVTSASPGEHLTVIDGGWRVKMNDAGTHYIDVFIMLFNYRIAATPTDNPYLVDRHWCYAGRGRDALLRCVLAAMAWDGAQDTEPEGWNKNGQTGEWRPPPLADAKDSDQRGTPGGGGLRSW